MAIVRGYVSIILPKEFYEQQDKNKAIDYASIKTSQKHVDGEVKCIVKYYDNKKDGTTKVKKTGVITAHNECAVILLNANYKDMLELTYKKDKLKEFDSKGKQKELLTVTSVMNITKVNSIRDKILINKE